MELEVYEAKIHASFKKGKTKCMRCPMSQQMKML